MTTAEYTRVPTERLTRLLKLIDPAPIVADGKVHVFKNPDPAEVLRLVSAEVRAMLDESSGEHPEAELLRLFVGAAYPVAKEINPRGHNWSEAYLDQALAATRKAGKGK